MSLKLCKVIKYKDGKIISSEYVDAFEDVYKDIVGINTKEARTIAWNKYQKFLKRKGKG